MRWWCERVAVDSAKRSVWEYSVEVTSGKVRVTYEVWKELWEELH